MNQCFRYFLSAAIVLLIALDLQAQPEFKYGFGLGVNFSIINEVNSYVLFEDITGAEYETSYAPLFSNIGNQYFFHGEVLFSNLVLALKPGTYSYKFTKTEEIVFSTETVERESAYLLRYINVPLELKYMVGSGNFKPFIGGNISYGYLLQQGGDGNHSFIRSKFTAGPVFGTYHSVGDFELNFTFGYDYGLHIITNKADRYNTGASTPYSQSDIKLNGLYATVSVLFSIQEKSSSNGSLDCPTFSKGRKPKTSKSFKNRK